MSDTQPTTCWMNLEQAATYCGTSVKTLRRRISRGELPAYRIGGRSIRVRQPDVDALFQQIPTAQAA